MPNRKSILPESQAEDNSPPPSANGAGSSCEPVAAPEAEPTATDPYDPATLRLSQDFSASFSVKKSLLSVPVRKPDKSWFVRVHPDEAYRLQTAVIELKEDRETYLVAPALWPELTTEATFSPRVLFTTINSQSVLFLWPIRLPGPDARKDEWNRTALEAASRAVKGWVRLTANMSLGAYDVLEANGQLAEPEWPNSSFREVLRIAFQDRYIIHRDHPVLRRLRGRVSDERSYRLSSDLGRGFRVHGPAWRAADTAVRRGP
jgi:hypothetical protein